MKRQLLTACLLGITATALAQPTIQSSQFDWLTSPSFSFKYQTGQTAVAPGASGANASWNFSSLAGSSTLNYTTTACSADPDCGSFTGANQVVNLGTSAKVFYNKTANGMEEVGETGSGAIVYTDPMKWLQFPVTFNQTFSDSYTGSGASGARTGTLTSTIDGYGTLVTPTGTYTNVLRQKIVDNTVVTVGSPNMNMTLTQYYWMAPNVPHYIMSLIITEITGLPVPVAPTYTVSYTTATGSTAIHDKETLAEALTIYPNPASDQISIEAGSLLVASVDIFNMLGQKIASKAIGQTAPGVVTLDRQGWSAGCYFLKINTDKGIVTKQVMIR